MANRDSADELGELIELIQSIWTDLSSSMTISQQHRKPLARYFLHRAMKLADVPPRLFDIIELMLWDDNSTEMPKLPLGPFMDYEAAWRAMRFEALHAPHPNGKRPSAAKQKDVADRADVDIRTVRRWQRQPFYRNLVLSIRVSLKDHPKQTSD